ncbi:hypothetical protein [Kitasatospora sp. SUK 42]|uniref:hypothetical protein n=1 Tax=Kitasatospora sp. SUK 42 TaxID=1588882 RepID=UPI0018C98F25|nr:hypothetical protein [Kitasatospora sp. SUK 42]MBV2155019.1 hypothetical protein [Kitasatospora sp. SUK 42]
MPSKPRRRTGGFAEVLAALPPATGTAGGPYRQYPVAAGGFLDARGRYWRLARGPLERRLAKRLMTDADEMTLGDWGGGWHEDFPDDFVPVLLTPEERPAAWQAALAEDHQAYEFRAEGGLTLLYLDISC